MKHVGRTLTRRPSGEHLSLGGEGSGIALLLALVAVNATLLNEEAESGAHLLSRDAELSRELLVGHGLSVIGERVKDVLPEVNNLLVHLRLAGTSGVLLDLLDLLRAERDDLLIVSHLGGDAGVEVLLGGLGLGHGSSPFLPCGCPLVSPFGWLFVYWGGHPRRVWIFSSPFFLIILYHIFRSAVKHFLLFQISLFLRLGHDFLLLPLSLYIL